MTRNIYHLTVIQWPVLCANGSPSSLQWAGVCIRKTATTVIFPDWLFDSANREGQRYRDMKTRPWQALGMNGATEWSTYINLQCITDYRLSIWHMPVAFNSHKILIKNNDFFFLTGFCYPVQHHHLAPEELSVVVLIHSFCPREPHLPHYLQTSLDESALNNGSLT